MDRLTFAGNFCDIAQCESTPYGSYCESGGCTRRKVWEQLKAYEDTGLTPEEITAMQHTLDEYHEVADPLLRAQADGRLVVLPCKVGDTVWAASGKIIKCEIREPYLCDGGGIEYLVAFDCDGSDCRGCPFDRWTQDCFGERYCESEYGYASFCASFKDSDIGKTVFLTREEAEKALEAMKNE